MNLNWIKIIATALGLIFLLAGLFLVGYDIYWLATRKGSLLGAGFAVLFIGIGIVLIIIGSLLLYKFALKKEGKKGMTI